MDGPPIVTPGAQNAEPPSDAFVLFDGKDKSQWKNADTWEVKDGVLICGKAQISTKADFGDCQLHIEWSAPTPAVGSGQGRGNSGVFRWAGTNYKCSIPSTTSIQDHGNPVRFRNIWIRELQPVLGVQEREPFLRDGNKETPIPKSSDKK